MALATSSAASAKTRRSGTYSGSGGLADLLLQKSLTNPGNRTERARRLSWPRMPNNKQRAMFQSVKLTHRHFPRMRYRCPSCRETHEGFPALAYELPDAIFALSTDERQARAVMSSDLCILDDARYFIRCVLAVPVQDYDEDFEYGPWVELSAEDFGRYSVWFNLGVSPGWHAADGRIANAFPASAETTLGLACRIELPDADDQRPSVRVCDEAHPIHDEQNQGMPVKRATELVAHLKGFVLIVD